MQGKQEQAPNLNGHVYENLMAWTLNWKRNIKVLDQFKLQVY